MVLWALSHRRVCWSIQVCHSIPPFGSRHLGTCYQCSSPWCFLCPCVLHLLLLLFTLFPFSPFSFIHPFSFSPSSMSSSLFSFSPSPHLFLIPAFLQSRALNTGCHGTCSCLTFLYLLRAPFASVSHCTWLLRPLSAFCCAWCVHSCNGRTSWHSREGFGQSGPNSACMETQWGSEIPLRFHCTECQSSLQPFVSPDSHFSMIFALSHLMSL